MATVYKRKRSRALPPGAEIIVSKGKRYAVWTDRRTRRKRRAPLNREGTKVRIEDRTYTILYFDENGKRRRKGTKYVEKAAAERLANKIEAEIADRREGLVNAVEQRIHHESRRELEQHLRDFERKMRAAGRDEKHIGSTISYVEKIAEHAGFASPSDITADGVHAFLSHLADCGKSARTQGAYATAIKGFAAWLVETNKIGRDPLASVTKPNPKRDRRRERRFLLHEEWEWLAWAVEHVGEERYGVPAGERLLLYATAIQTGLRLSELRSLTRGRMYLDRSPPYITCKADSTKNQKDAKQYIQPQLAAMLADLIATKLPKVPVFRMPKNAHVPTMLAEDLASARSLWLDQAKHAPDEHARRRESDFLERVNHEGEVLDFHALRHTCGAWLALAGAHPKVVQTVMRHSTITLTMDTYGHLFPGQDAAAIASLPAMLGDDAPQEMRATGTDDHLPPADDRRFGPPTAELEGRQMGPQLKGGGRLASANGGESATQDVADHPTTKASRNPLKKTTLGEVRRDVASGGDGEESGGHGTRTRNRQSRHLISNLRRTPENAWDSLEGAANGATPAGGDGLTGRLLEWWGTRNQDEKMRFLASVEAQEAAREALGRIDAELIALARGLLEADARQGGLLSIEVLRSAANLAREDFDAALSRLAIGRRIDLYPHDFSASLTPEEKASYFETGGQVFNALSLR